MIQHVSAIFRQYSIKRKLMVFFLLLSSIGILVTSVSFMLNQFYSYNKSARQEIKAQASILAKNTSAALTFNDQAAANELLSGLKANPRIVAVAILTADNVLFAHYVAAGSAAGSRLRNEFALLFQPSADSRALFTALHKSSGVFNFLEMHPLASEPIMLDNQKVGTVVIQTDMHYLYRELQFLTVLMSCVALTTFLIAWLLAARFQRIISDPIISLSNVMKQVSSGKNYALRVVSDSSDEIGTLIAGFNEMLQEIQDRDRIVLAQQQQLLDEKNSRIRKLTAAVEQSANSIVITSLQGDIEYVNPYFCATTGYTLDEVIGKNPRILKANPGASDKYRELWQNVQNGGRWSGEFLNRKKNGELFWEQATISPVLDDQGIITSLIAIKVDITERKKVEAEMLLAKEQAEAANRAKSEFLANMSHEIRTPMNGIIGMTDLAIDTKLDHEQLGYMRSIKSSAENLLSIINDVLDFSKIEVGRIDLDVAPFLLRSMLGQTLRTLSARANQKGLEIVFSVGENVPDALLGDSGRLRQILINLVGNAIKFTDKGDICIAVRLVEALPDAVCLKFDVTDKGIGITPEQQERIFEAFEQGDASTTKQFGGTGLGLAISKKLVALMNGVINVRSIFGEGSCFSFTATLGLQDKVSFDSQNSEIMEGISVLVIDGNVINRQVLNGFLSRWRMVVQLASTADEALTVLSDMRNEVSLPELILAGDNLPDMDGWDLVSCLRQDNAFDSVKVLIMSSAWMHDDVCRCEELRIAGCLTKPIILEELHDALIDVIRGHKVQNSESAPAQNMREEHLQCSVLVVDDVEINRELLRITLEKQGHRITVAQNGREAVDQFSQGAFDIIFMDMQMPILDGYGAVREIRIIEHNNGLKRTPIVAMTAYAMQGDREKCLAANMDGYLSKPARPVEIIAMLNQMVNVESTNSLQPEPGESKEPLAEPAPEQKVSDEPLPAFDRNELLERLGGREEIMARFVAMFTKNVAVNVNLLQTAIGCGDCEQIQMQAHAIKGAAANIAARRARQTATAMEGYAREGKMEEAFGLFSQLKKDLEAFQQEVST